MCPEPSQRSFLIKGYSQAPLGTRVPLRSSGANRAAGGGAKNRDDGDQTDQGDNGVGSEGGMSADVPVDAQRQHHAASTSTGSAVVGFAAATESKGDQGNGDDFLPAYLDGVAVGLRNANVFERLRDSVAEPLVGAGLPLHIVSTLLGHMNLETTRGYTAVFPEQVIQAHHAFIERRRQTRPGHEARAASDTEWAEFEQHFLLRRVALGTCHRPYATPCVHEHACIKCRFLQVDPAQTGRLEDMTNNADERLAEARQQHWLGEVSALEESLVHLRRRQEEAARLREEEEEEEEED